MVTSNKSSPDIRTRPMIFSSWRKVMSVVSIILAELLTLYSLLMPWFSIKMSVPLMGITMNGTYDFFLFNRMKISIEGLPGAFAGAIASEETILVRVHPLFWSPVLGLVAGLWPLVRLIREKSYYKHALVSAVLVLIIALEMKFLSIRIGKKALSQFVSLMESVGANISYSNSGSNLFLVSGALMLIGQIPNLFKEKTS